MSAAYDKEKTEMGNMDEMQFNASLDALLDGENLNDEGSSTGGASSPFPVPESINMNAQQQQQQQSMQRFLSGSGSMNHATTTHDMGAPLPITSYGRDLSTNSSAAAAAASYPAMASYGSSSMYAQPPPAEYITSLDASSVVSSTPSGSSRTTNSKSRKRTRDASAVSEDEGERGRRKQDRNMREQQRSQKITHQIDHLKELLASANVPFKPDKYSTLVSVADYIQDLQERSALLDVEHKKLVETISRTNDMVNGQYMPASTNGSNPPGSSDLNQASAGNDENGGGGDGEGFFVPNIDYRNVFSRCGVPLAVLSIDGRFLECNHGFERLTGYKREELLPCEQSGADDDNKMAASTLNGPGEVSSMEKHELPPPASRNMSLFNLLSREHMEAIFLAMSEMLRQTPGKLLAVEDEAASGEAAAAAATKKGKDYWSGDVCLGRNMEVKLRMNVSLVRSHQGQAKFFDCSLSLVEE